jgi:TPR repeat protein
MMIKVLAHDGDAEAQCMLASAYRQGLLGLTQSDTEAFKWYERSANQGYLDAMELLSIIYITGEGVTKDLVNAYLWAELAINYGSSQAIEIRRKLIAFMTKEQIAEAQKLSLEWVEKRQD